MKISLLNCGLFRVLDHADVMRSLYTKLSATIDAQSIAPIMFERRSLTLDDLQSIQSRRKKPTKAAEKLLNMVMNQTGSVYDSFLHALTSSGQHHVRELIVAGTAEGQHLI